MTYVMRESILKESVIRRTAIYPADDGVFLSGTQAAALGHAAGGNSRADGRTGTEHLIVIGKLAGAIGTAAGMAPCNGAGGLYDGAYIGSKGFVGNSIAVNSGAATATFFFAAGGCC